MFTLDETQLHPQVCLRGPKGPAVGAFEYMRLVGGMVLKLKGYGERLAFHFDDSYLFSVAVFAAMALDKKIVILPNHKADTLHALRDEYDEILTEEAFLGVAPMATSPKYRIDKNCRVIFMTSGSGGVQKKVEKRFENLFAEVQVLERTFFDRKGVVVLATVSHQHIYGFLFRILWPLCTKQTFMSTTMEYPEQLAAVAAEMDSFSLISTPAFLKRFFVPGLTIKNCRSVFSSGGLLNFATSRKSAESFGVVPTEVFGSTESGGVAYREQTCEAVPWKTFSGIQIQLRGEDQIFVQGPYFDEADLAMGDRAQVVNDGFVLLGRNDDIVKVEERRVSLGELRKKISELAWIQDNTVLFFEEGLRQQTVCVAILSPAGNQIRAERGESFVSQEIRNHLRSAFEASVIPRKFRFVEKLPYNAQSKLLKTELLALFSKKELLDIRVLKQSPAHLSLEILFSMKSGLFDGHFPDLPLLPGVIQAHLAITLFERYQGQKIQFGGFKAMKFFSPIFPGNRLQLDCDFAPQKGQMTFQYIAGEKIFSKGVVIHGA